MFCSSTADVARPSALRGAWCERSAPVIARLFLSLVLQPLPPDDAERRVPDRETVRPNLERTDSPALLPLDSGSFRNNLGFARSPLDSRLRGNDVGRASAVWLAFVGGASVCSASEPYSYNGLRNRVSAAFRPSSQTSFMTCGGHRRWIRVLAAPCRPARGLFTFIQLSFAASFERLRRPFTTRRFFVFGALFR